jgi:hypothetical protein
MSKQRAGLLLALCLLALTAVPAMASTDIKYVLQCGNAKSVPPDDDDPVLLTRIVAIAGPAVEPHLRALLASDYPKPVVLNLSQLLGGGCFQAKRWGLTPSAHRTFSGAVGQRAIP